jgi:hypothetical protein
MVLQDENSTCDVTELHEIFTHFLILIKSSNRIDNEDQLPMPFQISFLQELMAKNALPKRLTCDEFINAMRESSLAEWLNCPLYLAEVSISLRRTSPLAVTRDHLQEKSRNKRSKFTCEFISVTMIMWY